MLYKISHRKQSNRKQLKSWFASADMDMFIWIHQQVPVNFHLSYNKHKKEQLISWHQYRGFNLYLVDNGESFPERYKKSPLLISTCGQQAPAKLARHFLLASENIETSLADFIYARQMEYRLSPLMPGARHAGRPFAR